MPIDNLKVRVPHEVKEWLKARAEANCRTMNGEILALLQATKLAERKVKREAA
ncbi:Arc family DNA-binding protein [Mesorhizobium sp. KR1-2]|uniref:Arc family DNA-binding protein n=1 Tax=Mesorhizobium sp. KR1-2 TaxID=3156609 RepID=UPI0032B42B6E